MKNNTNTLQNDTYFVKKALKLAEQAFEQGEVPVGAVVVKDGEIIGEGYNLRESNGSVIAHAEIVAIEQACRVLGTWRLSGCTLYVTMEPCPMCAGALINSRISRVVYGCEDAAAGCLGSVINFNSYPFNHSFETVSGICAEESSELLSKFFKNRRDTKRI